MGRLRLEANRRIAVRLRCGDVLEAGSAIVGNAGKTEGEAAVGGRALVMMRGLRRLPVRCLLGRGVRMGDAVGSVMRFACLVRGRHRRGGVRMDVGSVQPVRCGHSFAHATGGCTGKRDQRHENEAAQGSGKEAGTTLHEAGECFRSPSDARGSITREVDSRDCDLRGLGRLGIAVTAVGRWCCDVICGLAPLPRV